MGTGDERVSSNMPKQTKGLLEQFKFHKVGQRALRDALTQLTNEDSLALKIKQAIGDDGMYNIQRMPEGEHKKRLLVAYAEMRDGLSSELQKPRQVFDVIMVKRHPNGIIFDLQYTLASPVSLTPLGKSIRGRSRSKWPRWKLDKLLHDAECGNLSLPATKSVKPLMLANLIDEWDLRYSQMIALNQLQVVGMLDSNYIEDNDKLRKEVEYHTQALRKDLRPLYHLTKLSEIPMNSHILRETQAAAVVKDFEYSAAKDQVQVKQLAARVLEAWREHQ